MLKAGCEDLPAQVVIPPRVLVRKTEATFTIAEYIEDCTDTLNTTDAVILRPEINAPCQKGPTFALWVYASVQNSRALLGASFYEIKLETNCVVVEDGFVFMTETRAESSRPNTGKYPPEQNQKRRSRRGDACEHSLDVPPEFDPTSIFRLIT
jgi:hypothetical protein